MPAIADQVASIEHDLAVAQTSVDSLRSENDQLKQALTALQTEHSALQAKHNDAIALVDETRQHADGVASAALMMLKVSRRTIGAIVVQPSEGTKALAALAPQIEQAATQAVAEAIEPEKIDVRPELPVIDQGQQETTVEPVQGDSGDEQPQGFSPEMQDALHADAEKLSQLTGQDHSVVFLDVPNTDRLRAHMAPGDDPLPMFLAPRNPPAASVLGSSV